MKKGHKRKHSSASAKIRKQKIAKLAEETENDKEEVPNELNEMKPLVEKGKWRNKQRVLVFTSRGTSYKARYFIKDLQNLMPHSKTDVKMDRKGQLQLVNEICEMKNCNKCIFLVGKKKKDLYMWMSNVPHGPSALFHVEYLNMMKELKFTGNCLKGSRPVLCFDKTFDDEPHNRLLKELFTQIFGTPRYHPKSQPFVDHVISLSLLDGRIWFRNYQIVGENGDLVEIGPRFTMILAKILSGSFGGPVLYINPDYTSPNVMRRMLKKKSQARYTGKQLTVQARKETRSKYEKTFPTDDTDTVFDTHGTG
ncbi:ribosome biogenesis protein BRX1 homolog [Styela clava]|uniref:ribosome biogenesis protein BRX1 homolog n=1 Tax=Styela clava TaxID=7725 RepID=UPI001939607C|nr:ribosome biogenesis protein BRX1 homolog [Styela clava]